MCDVNELVENKNNVISYETYVSCGEDGLIDSRSFNYSSILSKLIVEAGTHCQSYASDLFISWESLMDKIHGITENTRFEEWFGFRDMGVDHKAFMNSRALETYSSIYRLTVDIDVEKMRIGMRLVEMQKQIRTYGH